MRRALTALFLVPIVVFGQDPQSFAVAAVGADAGQNQTAKLRDTVVLDGSGSTNPSGIGTLSYYWQFASRPDGSSAVLQQDTAVKPAFVVDVPGSYVVDLSVSNGIGSSSASVTVTTINTPPVANGGASQAVQVGSAVQLNGAGSTDVDGDQLSYHWSLIHAPAGSQAALNNAGAVNPTFSADVSGTYVAQLIVQDAKTSSAPATVTISTNVSQAPTAQAGPNQAVRPGTLALLNGSGIDPQGLPLTYRWAMIAKPAASQAVLSSSTISNPSFLVDVDGTYVAELIVNNGSLSSAPSTVTISTNTNTAPVAHAGANQNVAAGATVTLDGTSSSDAENQPLSYGWSLLSLPQGSAAQLTGAHTATPAFVADAAGTYVAQLMVNDGALNSRPATVTITAETAAAASAPATQASLGGSHDQPTSQTLNVGPVTPLVPTKVGIFRSSFFVTAEDVNGNISWDAGTDRTGNFGIPGDQIFFGDWDGSGTSKMGIFRPSNGLMALDTNGNLQYDAGIDKIGIFGQTGDIAIVGDWTGDGKTKVGIYRPSTSFFALDLDGNLKLTAADKTGTFGAPGDVPIVGDWTGDGKAKIGIFRNGTWALDNNGNILFDGGIDTVGGIGQAGDVPLLGDWNGDGRTKVGIYRANQALFGLDYNGNLAWDASDRAGNYGIVGDTPVVGDWDGTGVTRVGIFRTGAWAMDMNGNLAWDPGVDTTGGFGSPGDQPVLGRWPAPAGAASVTATSGTPQSATINTAFASPLIATVKDSGGNPVSGVVVTFEAPPATGASGTFAGGLTTATTNASGIATSAIFTANATAGTYNVTATAGALTVSFALTNNAGAAASITATGGTPQSAAINTAFASPLVATVKDSGGNPVNGVVVTFAAPPATGASGTFAGNVATATTNASGVATSAVFTANTTIGGYNVTASVGALTANFALTNLVGSASSMTATGGTPQSATISTAFASPLIVTIRNAGNNPVPGVVVTFTAPGSGASGTFAGNVTTATTNSLGIATSALFTANAAAGTYNILASVGSLTASFTLTNSPLPDIALTGASIGLNLETSISLTLSQPVPNGLMPPGLTVTLTSTDPSKVLLAGRPSDAGVSSLVVTVPEGQTILGGIYVQSLASSGVVTVTASAANYNSGAATITLTPSGFSLAGPAGVGAPLSVNQGATATLTVSSMQLDASLNIMQPQLVRGGLAVSVPVTSQTTSVGTITTSTLGFSGGSSTATTQFNTVSAGQTILAAGVPSGFNAPAQGSSLVATVTAPALTASSIAVGKNLVASGQIGIAGSIPAAGLTMTVTSNNPSLVLLSTTAGGAGSPSITLQVPQFAASSPSFYVIGLIDTGTTTYTASMPGFGTGTGTVTLMPSGFVIAGPTGLGQSSFPTTMASTNSTLTIYSVLLDSTLNYVSQMPVAAGVSITVTSANTAVGAIITSPVSIGAGSASATTQFQPLTQGSTVLTLTQPSGFSSPAQFTSVTSDVLTPGIAVSEGAIGFNLQMFGTVTLGAAAPIGGLDVTLVSNSGFLLLSDTGLSSGSGSITVHIPAGTTNGTYYMQATNGSGTATYTASASGFASRTGTITLTPSAAIIAGQFGLSTPFFSASLSGGPVPITVYMAQLDPNTWDVASIQALAGGKSVSVSLTSSVPGVGTMTSPITINGGPLAANGSAASFTPVGQGQTRVSVSPLGPNCLPASCYVPAVSDTSLTAVVGP